MIHPDENQLLSYVLQTLDERDSISIRHHLDECAECRAVCEAMQTDIALLSSVTVPVVTPTIPLPIPKVKWNTYPLLRIAAVLLIGFTIGFSTSELMRPDEREVSPQYTAVSIPPDSMQSRYAAEPLELGMFSSK